MVTASIIGTNNHYLRKSTVFLGTGLYTKEAFDAFNTLWVNIQGISAKHENFFFPIPHVKLSISALFNSAVSMTSPIKSSFEGEVGLILYTSYAPSLVVSSFSKSLNLMKMDCMGLLESGRDFMDTKLNRREKEDIRNMDAICEELFYDDNRHSKRFNKLVGSPFDPFLASRLRILNDEYLEDPNRIKEEELKQTLFESWEISS